MAREEKRKPGKGVPLVKSRLKPLRQEDDTREVRDCTLWKVYEVS